MKYNELQLKPYVGSYLKKQSDLSVHFVVGIKERKGKQYLECKKIKKNGDVSKNVTYKLPYQFKEKSKDAKEWKTLFLNKLPSLKNLYL